MKGFADSGKFVVVFYQAPCEIGAISNLKK